MICTELSVSQKIFMPSGITRIPQESLGYYHEKSEAIASVKEFFATIDGEKWKTTKTLREKQLHQTTIAWIKLEKDSVEFVDFLKHEQVRVEVIHSRVIAVAE